MFKFDVIPVIKVYI